MYSSVCLSAVFVRVNIYQDNIGVAACNTKNFRRYAGSRVQCGAIANIQATLTEYDKHKDSAHRVYASFVYPAPVCAEGLELCIFADNKYVVILYMLLFGVKDAARNTLNCHGPSLTLRT